MYVVLENIIAKSKNTQLPEEPFELTNLKEKDKRRHCRR